MTPEERARQTLKMEELEAERDLVESIRAGVAAAAKVIDRRRGAGGSARGGIGCLINNCAHVLRDWPEFWGSPKA